MNYQERQKNWSNYWSKNNIDSCSQGVKSDNSEIDTFWEESLKGLNEESHILDLCTGKGDVIKKLITKQKEEGHPLSQYSGVDLSELEEGTVKKRFGDFSERVNFQYGVTVEQLPFEEKSFELVTSQFGIEYALNENSIREIFRVVKPEGRVRLVVHHVNSVLTKVAQEEQRHINFLLKDSDFFTLAEKLIPIFAKLRNPANAKKLNKDQNATSLRNLFNQASQGILERASKSKYPDVLKELLSFSEGVFRIARDQGAKSAKDQLLNYKKDLEQSKWRMDDLVEVALNEKDIQGLEDMVASAGHKVLSIKELHSNNYIVAWGVEIS